MFEIFQLVCCSSILDFCMIWLVIILEVVLFMVDFMVWLRLLMCILSCFVNLEGECSVIFGCCLLRGNCCFSSLVNKWDIWQAVFIECCFMEVEGFNFSLQWMRLSMWLWIILNLYLYRELNFCFIFLKICCIFVACLFVSLKMWLFLG